MSLMRTYRRALGLSQSAFAARLNVPLETYRPWDAGRREPWPTMLRPSFRCFRHQLLLPSAYLVLTKPLRLDIQCQRGASVKIGWKYLDD